MDENEKILCWLLFLYALFFSFFQIMPTFIPGTLKNPVRWEDAFDLLTPFFVVPAAYILFSRMKKVAEGQECSSRRAWKTGKIVFGAGLILYIDGHGVHLSANSLSRLVEHLKGSSLYDSIYLFDEVISHFLWDGGVILISTGLIICAFRLHFPSTSKRNLLLLVLGSALYSFTFAVNGIEGQTVILTFPAASLSFIAALVLYIRGRQKGSHNPVLLFFVIAYLVSVLLFSSWWLTQGGFPEFSELGWI